MGIIRLTGRLAWLVWSMAHIYFLIGFRNRLIVAVDWLWSYLTFHACPDHNGRRRDVTGADET